MDGALIVDKPVGMSSHTDVVHLRRIVGTRRVGHTGTLDPFATGVLVVLVGKATRLMQFLSGAEKEYEATIRFGYATDTGDITGQRIRDSSPGKSAGNLNEAEIQSAIHSLRGEIEQVPPMYSAKKIKGRKLYELARRGEQIERQPIQVNISSFTAIETDGPLLTQNDDGTADLAVRVVCSAGTYVRTLAEDVGKQVGVGAHLAALRRTRAGSFTIRQARTLDQLRALAQDNSIGAVLVSPDAILAHLPALDLTESDAQRVRHGLDIVTETDHQNQQPVRLRNGGELIAIGLYDAQLKTIHPHVVLGQ